MTKAVETGGSSVAVLIGATAASVIWVAIWLALVLLVSGGCSDLPGSVWATHVECLAPNEIGDTLGGGFAPLALVWLMAAVLLQSGELRAQREELALTRKEMSETREVLEQQREEARRSAEYIGKQTELLSDEQRLRASAEAEKNTDQLIDVLTRQLNKLSENLNVSTVEMMRLGRNSTGHLSIRFNYADGDNNYRIAAHLSSAIDLLVQRFKRLYTGQELKSNGIDGISPIILTIINCEHFAKGAALPKQLQVSLVGLEKLRQNLQYIAGLPNVVETPHIG